MFRDEISPWVIGVTGSIYRKVKTWDEARNAYNSRLANGIIEVLR